jgi:hypothetical protein
MHDRVTLTLNEEYGAFLAAETTRLAERLGPARAQEVVNAWAECGMAWQRFSEGKRRVAVRRVLAEAFSAA